MRTRPLGCMTFTALVAAVIALLAIVGVIVVTGNSMFSPGALSALTVTDGAQAVSTGGVTSHAQLEGRCDACHAAIWSGQKMGDRCVACHADVATQSATGTGLHGKLDANAATCLRCHTEHHGATASTTLADPRVFPHEQTGFVLTAHAQPAVAAAVGCRSCHPGSPRDYKVPDCVSCHQKLDAAKMAKHTDTYGAQCLNCHDGKDTYGHAFVHTTYALTGKHAGADCASCHKGSTTLAALRTTSTTCATCHAKNDVHQGRLGQSCGTCHTPDGWTGAQLDHGTQTTFPLAGKHAAVACESCHVNRQWSGLGTTCASCHKKDDPHAGKFGADCASCHNASDWKDAKFDHSITGFSLAQAHASVSCDKCHANKRFAGTPTTCVGCHASQDKHNGVLGNRCEQCHSATQWANASYNHNAAAFKLVGAHVGVTCERCHSKAPPASTVTTCVGCHAAKDVHNGSMGSVCETCHKPTAWMDVKVNHQEHAHGLRSVPQQARVPRQPLRRRLLVLPHHQGLAPRGLQPRRDQLQADRRPPLGDLPQVPHQPVGDVHGRVHRVRLMPQEAGQPHGGHGLQLRSVPHDPGLVALDVQPQHHVIPADWRPHEAALHQVPHLAHLVRRAAHIVRRLPQQAVESPELVRDGLHALPHDHRVAADPLHGTAHLPHDAPRGWRRLRQLPCGNAVGVLVRQVPRERPRREPRPVKVRLMPSRRQGRGLASPAATLS